VLYKSTFYILTYLPHNWQDIVSLTHLLTCLSVSKKAAVGFQYLKAVLWQGNYMMLMLPTAPLFHREFHDDSIGANQFFFAIRL